MRSFLFSTVFVASTLLVGTAPAIAETVQPKNSLQYLCKATDTGAGDFEFSGSLKLYQCKDKNGKIYFENDRKCSGGAVPYLLGSNTAGTALQGVFAFRQLADSRVGICYSFMQGFARTASEHISGAVFSADGLSYPENNNLISSCQSLSVSNVGAYSLYLLKNNQPGVRSVIGATCTLRVRLK